MIGEISAPTKMKRIAITCLLIILLPCSTVLADTEQIVSIDSGTFTGYFGFGIERVSGLHGFKGGIGIIDYESLRLGFLYKYYFPERNTSEVQRSRVFIGPDISLTLNDIISDFHIRSRLGLNMGYTLRWGSVDQYIFSLSGGFALAYPPYPSWYSLNLFQPSFNVSFGYSF